MIQASSEYCLLWINHWSTCMQKGEWSGWAQAFGAMLALGLAIGLQLKARADSRRDAKLMARAYVTQLSVVADEIVRACDGKDLASFVGRHHALGDVCSMGQGVPFAFLRERALASYMSIRYFAADIHNRSSGQVPPLDWQYWGQEFSEFSEMASEVNASLRESK